jgi:hypothetical protein
MNERRKKTKRKMGYLSREDFEREMGNGLSIREIAKKWGLLTISLKGKIKEWKRRDQELAEQAKKPKVATFATVDDVPGESIEDMVDFLRGMVDSGFRVVVEDCALDTAVDNSPLQFCIALREKNKSEHSGRIRAGIRRAKMEGKVLGRPRAQINMVKAIALRYSGLGWERMSKEMKKPSTTLRNRMMQLAEEYPPVGDGLKRWDANCWDYSTTGKEKVTSRIFDYLDDKGNLKFMVMPGEGRELKRLNDNFQVDWGGSYCVERNPECAARIMGVLMLLEKRGDIEHRPGFFRGDVDAFLLNKKGERGINYVHLDYNGPLSVSHIVAAEAATMMLDRDGVIAITVSANDRTRAQVRHEDGVFPWIKEDPELLFWQPYEGIAGQKMETYCFRGTG